MIADFTAMKAISGSDDWTLKYLGAGYKNMTMGGSLIITATAQVNNMRNHATVFTNLVYPSDFGVLGFDLLN